ncbi:hypothetical protein ABH922_003895 [Rhodococcus sp. 27YEA15]|uniref:hypothetical protein n=1 Tax=Rhodococcus sp. 27YEA15 TaxID=3156259 RepID=UPI003C7DF689
MDSWHRGRLSAEQAAHVERRLPGVRFNADLSWNLVETVVLDVEADRGRFVVKAAGPNNHHIGREITAHQSSTSVLVDIGRAAVMIDYNGRRTFSSQNIWTVIR